MGIRIVAGVERASIKNESRRKLRLKRSLKVKIKSLLSIKVDLYL